MKSSYRKSALRSATCLTLAAMSLGTAGQAMAQETAGANAAADDAAAAEETIIVTGSRILNRSSIDTPNPIVTFTAADIERTGDTNIVDTLVRNPALIGSIDSSGASGQTASIGLTGVNLLDLRNLGYDRTLVLVNGKRHVAANADSAAVDINTIPQDLIERVDVLTGGASAIYGADGVSGVVNFVLKRNFEGLTIRAQNGITKYGDGRQTKFAVTGGMNFADDRGNIALSYEYAKQKRVDSKARPFLGNSKKWGVIVQNPDDFDTDDPNVPDRIPIYDTRWADSSVDGAVDLDFDFIPDFTGSGLPYDRGTLLPGSGGRTMGGSSTPTAGYYGDIIPETERHVANLLASFEFSPAIRLFGEGKFAKNKAFSIGQPTYDFYTLLAPDNYYLNERYGDLVSGPALISRDNFDFGQRGEYNDRETWRTVIGVDGALSDHLRYELSYVWGQNKINVQSTNNRIIDRYYAALDAVDDGSGNPVCRISLSDDAVVDPFEWNYSGAPVTFNAGTGSGCVPLNILGNGVASKAALDWVLTDALTGSKVTQNVISGSVNGDTGAFFKLPGGPISFAIGAEYRKEKSKFWASDLVANGYVDGFPPLSSTGGQFNVKEVFGELNVPILADMPFAKLLSVGGAIRYSDYSSIGTTTTWKINGVYAPIDDLRFRATYSKSVRAPNIAELYQAESGTYLFITDPCDKTKLGDGKPPRTENCQTILGSLGLTPEQIAAFSPTTDPEASTSILGFTGGNPDLAPETAKTWTAGVVVQPNFVPRLTVTFDWYNIKIQDAINTATAQDMAELCVDQPTVENPFCSNITRDPETGFIIGWRSGPQNVAKFQTAGFDATLNYTVPIGSTSLRSSLVVGYLDQLEYVPTLGADVDDDLREPYKPKWTAALDLDWNIGNLTASYSLTWWDKTRRFTTEQIKANPDLSDPKYFFYKARTEHDVRLSYDLDKQFTIYGGINNLTNSKPDFSIDYPVSGYGRFMYVGVKADLASLF